MGDQGHVQVESWPTLTDAARSGYTRQARRLQVRAAQAVKNLPGLAFWRRSPVPVNAAKLAYLERRGSVGAGAALAAAAKVDPAGSLEPETQPVWRTDVEPWLVITAADIEAWLAWKAATESRWIRVGVVAAVIAAILAGLAWVVLLSRTAATPDPSLVDRQHKTVIETLDRLAGDVRELKTHTTGTQEGIAAAIRRLERLQPRSGATTAAAPHGARQAHPRPADAAATITSGPTASRADTPPAK